MKAANRRLFISLLALVIAVAIAATTTFAWFSMNTTPEANNIKLSVTTDDSVYISKTENGEFKKSIDFATDDFTAIKLIPVSAVGSKDSYTLQDLNNATKTAGTDYFETTIHFRSASEYALSLSDIITSSTASADALALTAWDDFEKGSIYSGAIAKDTKLNTITNGANAIRVGLVGKADGQAVSGTIYDPNFDKGFSAASGVASNAGHEYFEFINGSAPAKTTEAIASTNEIGAYYRTGLVAATSYTAEAKYFTRSANGTYTLDSTITSESALNDAASVVYTFGTSEVYYTKADGAYTAVDKANFAVTDATQFYAQNEDVPTVLKLVKDSNDNWYKGSLTIRIWLEGTDADCFETILADTITTSLHFSGKIVTTV